MITLNGLLSVPSYAGTTALLQKKTSPLNIDPIRIDNFLQARQLRGDLPQAKFFIKNLETLKIAVNPDGTGIKGVERIFNNAEERVSKGENVSGHYFEAVLGIAFLNAGFKVKEISPKKFIEPEDKQAYIKKREIDFVVIKNGIKYYVEAKVHIGRVIESDKKNNQTKFLIEIANEFGAVPVIVLNSAENTFTEDLELKGLVQKDFSGHDIRQITRYIERYPQLHFWKVPEGRYQTAEDLDNISAKKRIS